MSLMGETTRRDSLRRRCQSGRQTPEATVFSCTRTRVPVPVQAEFSREQGSKRPELRVLSVLSSRALGSPASTVFVPVRLHVPGESRTAFSLLVLYIRCHEREAASPAARCRSGFFLPSCPRRLGFSVFSNLVPVPTSHLVVVLLY